MPKKKNSWIISLAIFAVLFTLSGGVFAKYIYENDGRNLFSAKEFYFTSDFLKENVETYVLNSEATEIVFKIGNNKDKLRFSQDNIEYTISVECEEENNTKTPIISLNQGSLPGGRVSEETISITNIEKGKTYVVTATGKAGYRQTLSAKFEISDNDENVYKHIRIVENAYAVLTVWTGNVNGTLSVSVPAGLIPDNTDSTLKDIKNYNDSNMYTAFTFTDEKNFTQKYSSYTYRFFMDDNKDLSAEAFDVRVLKGGASYVAGTGALK